MTIERGQRVTVRQATGDRTGSILQIRPDEAGRAVVTVQTEPNGELVTVYENQCRPAPQR